MKEHFQDYGVRRWAGDDLIELQSEPLEAIQRLVEPYAPCIIQGCDLEEEGGTRRIGAGLVALWQVDESGRKQGVKIARFGGCTPSSLPVYLTLQCSTENRVYADGRSKAIAYLYEARETSLEEEARGRYPLVIGPEGGARLAENLYVGFAGAAERKNIEPGERLCELFGKVRRWFSDMKGLAFKEKVSESDLEAALRGKLEEKVSGSDLEEALRGKVDKESGKGLSGNDFTDALKGKLEGIEAGANRYVHPAYGPATGYPASNQTPGFGSTFSLSQPSRDGNGHVSLTTRTVRIPDTPASRSAAGLMSAADKTKLEGIAAGAQVNPAYATVGGSISQPANTEGYYQTGACNSGAYNNWVGSSDTVARGDHKHGLFIANATTAKPGLMSKTDKGNLDLFSGSPKVIYACTFGVNGGVVTKGEEKTTPGVSVSLEYKNNDGKYVQVRTTQSRYSHIIPIVTGQSAAPAFFDGNIGNGSFRIRLRHGTDDAIHIGGASLVLIGI